MRKWFYLALALCGCCLPSLAVPVEATNKLEIALNNNGLQCLSYGGQTFLHHPSDGALSPFARTPIFQHGQEARMDDSAPRSQTLDAETATVTHRYAWGLVSATYDAHDKRLDITMTVTNTTDDLLSSIDLQVARLNYPQAPKVSFVGQDPTIFNGGSGAANAAQRPPVVLVDYGAATLLVAGNRHWENFTAGVFFAEDKGMINRAGIGLSDIAPGQSKTAVLSLCFGAPGSTLRSLGGEFLDAYARANPVTLHWVDRRPIGKVFLASAGNGPDQMATNPNRWFMNAKDVQVSTDDGKAAFRERLLKFADGAVAALKQLGAQGGITWDPEGQRTGHTYYGDPRIIPDIAPEMEYRGKNELATVDAYFSKFKEAGLRYGVCVRPQRVSHQGNYWVQAELKSETERLAELEAKIAYAQQRWGCTLFYVDSDYAVTAREYRELHARHPDALLVPEWKTPQHYAYTAPLQSYSHFGISNAQTPPSIRDLYPQAFCVTFADGAKTAPPAARAALLAGVRNGDVLMPNAWYVTDDFATIRALYTEAHPVEKAVKEGEK